MHPLRIVALGGAFVATAAVLASLACGLASRGRETADAGAVPAGGECVTDSQRAGTKVALRRDVRAAIAREHDKTAWPARDDLVSCCIAVMESVIDRDGRAYLDEMRSRGAKISDIEVRGVRAEWIRWGLIRDEDVPESLDSESVFLGLWASAQVRRMDLVRINTTGVTAGMGMSVDYARDAWPYEGVRACLSVFDPPNGKPDFETGAALDGSPRSAFIAFPVVFGDGRSGLLRLNLFFDEKHGRWYPITMSIGSDAVEQWPFPFM